MGVQIDRMQPVRRIKTSVGGTEIPQPDPSRGGNTRYYNPANTMLGGTLQDVKPVCIELGNIKMAMGIDDLHKIIVGGCAWQTQ